MAREPNWPAIQKRYEAGEPPDKLAAAFKTPEKTIRRKAREEKWEKRLQPRREAKPRTPARNAARTSNALAERAAASVASAEIEILDPQAYLEQHRDDWQGLRQIAMALLPQVPLMEERNQGKNLAAIATALKLVQDGQRKHFGLEKGQAPEGPNDGTGTGQPIDEDEFKHLDPAERRRRIMASLRPGEAGQG